MTRLNIAVILVLLALATTGRGQDAAFDGVVLEDHSGTPVASALVRLSRPNAGVLKETETDRDGRFILGLLAAGDYQLVVSNANYVGLTAAFSTSLPVTSQTPTIRDHFRAGSGRAWRSHRGI